MIVVVGSYNVDYFVLVEDLPRPGETVRAIRTFSAHGGKGSNQAVSVSRLRGEVSLIAAVGDDDSGRKAVEFWKSEGVNVKNVRVIQGVPTGKAIIFVDRNGRNMIAVEPGANSYLRPEHLERALEVGRVLLTQLEIPEDTVRRALEDFDGIKILNPAPATLSDHSILKLADVITPNEIEASQLAKANDIPTIAERLSKVVRKAVVITLGEKGALLVTKDGKKRLFEALKVEPVDETGAGDVFNGALAVFLDRGYDLEVAVKKANIIAGISVKTYGALGPRWEEVEKEVEVGDP
ncbi:MAG: ribokinase [Thermoprotei archaeon]